MSPREPAPVGVEVHRGNVVESAHRVHLAVVDGAGNLVHSLGDPDWPVFLRSAAKPFQAVSLVTSGAADAFGLTEEELALACGSHAGEPPHVDVARRMLAKGGIDASLLQCGTHRPRNKLAREALGDARATPLHHNCSGKHAGMMLLQKHLGADPADYLDPASPAQQMVLDAVAHVAGVARTDVLLGTDGCSVPNFALPLKSGARMFARLAMPQGVDKQTADALARLSRAMLVHPHMVAGADLIDTDLMGASEDRLVSKAGAEGVQGVGDLASGMGLLLKVEDGAHRAVAPATLEALRQLGWLEARAFEVLGDWWLPIVKNWAGRTVGRIKPVLRLTDA